MCLLNLCVCKNNWSTNSNKCDEEDLDGVARTLKVHVFTRGHQQNKNNLFYVQWMLRSRGRGADIKET